MVNLGFATQRTSIDPEGRVVTRVLLRIEPATTAPIVVALGHSGTGAYGTDWTVPAQITIPEGKSSYPIVATVNASFGTLKTAVIELKPGSSYELRGNLLHTIRRQTVTSDAKPTAANTGPHGALTTMNGGTINEPGKVIENVRITGMLKLYAPGIIVRNYELDLGGGTLYGMENDYAPSGCSALLEDGAIHGHSASAAVLGHHFTIIRHHIYDMGGDALKLHGDSLVQDSFITDLGHTPGAHADGNQSRKGSKIVFRHNNIDVPIDQPGGESNSALLFSSEIGPISDVLVELNWLNGGNYTVWWEAKVAGTPSGFRLLSNRFGRGFRYGPLIDDGADSVIHGNVWDDTGELMDIND